MNINDICELPVADIAAPDCALFLWATFPMLPEAIRVIKAWGFQFKTVAFVWLKKNRKLMSEHYTKEATEPYIFTTDSWDGGTRKLITQEQYDHAVLHGFTKDFFRNAVLERVNIYCLPENADFTDSKIFDCAFRVCAARGIIFDGTDVYSSAFNTVDMTEASFTRATSFDHTHFYHFDLSNAQLSSRFHHCHFRHGRMDNTDLLMLEMNGGSFADIQTCGVKHLENAYFTCGGMTHDEVERYRQQNYEALQPNATQSKAINKPKTPEHSDPEPER